MAIDIRSKVTVSINGSSFDVISGNVSDEHFQSTGIIKTKGSCEIAGLHSFSLPAEVLIRFTEQAKNGTISRGIPRDLYLLSYSADVLRNTTTITYGCKFVQRADYAEDKVFRRENGLNFVPEPNEDDDTGVIVWPISASQVASYCAARIGVAAPGLLNKFSVSGIDLSSGYLNVLADLARSELYFGSAKGFKKLDEDSVETKLLAAADLIDLKPIGNGDLPPDNVVVNYSSIRLKSPKPPGDEDEDEKAKRNWELDTTTGSITKVMITVQKPDGQLTTLDFYYVPYSSTRTTYDAWDRKINSVTVDRSIGAAMFASYIQAAYEYALANDTPLQNALNLGNRDVEITTIQEIVYKIPAPTGPVIDPDEKTPPVGYDQVASETTTRYEPAGLLASSITPSFIGNENNLLSLPTGTIKASVSYVEHTTLERDAAYVVRPPLQESKVSSYGQIPITKTKIHGYKAYGYTSEGQQDLASRVQQGQTLDDIFDSAKALTFDGVEIRQVSGREAVLQARPRAAQRVLSDYAEGQPSSGSNGYSTERQAETVTLGPNGPTVMSVTMPYASDDTFTRTGSYPNYSYASTPASPNPQTAARKFGLLQKQLLRGMRYGLNITTTAGAMPSDPFGRVVIRSGGYGGVYQMSGTTYTFDSNGIVASTDGLFIGGTNFADGEGTPWFPVPAGVQLTYQAPITVEAPDVIGDIATVGSNATSTLNAAFPNAVIGEAVYEQNSDNFWKKGANGWTNIGPELGEFVDTSSMVRPFNEAVTCVGWTRTKLELTSFDYGLVLPVTSVTVRHRTRMVGIRVLKVEVPAAAITAAAVAPAVRTGASVKPPAVAISVAAAAPVVATGASVAVPLVAVTLSSAAPAVATGASVSVPAVEYLIEALAPLSAGAEGAFINVPALDVVFAVLAPVVATGASVSVPLVTIVLAAEAPQVTLDGDYFGSMAVQLYGWEAEFYVPWWGN